MKMNYEMSINFFKYTPPNMIKTSLCEPAYVPSSKALAAGDRTGGSEANPSAINFGTALISVYYKIVK